MSKTVFAPRISILTLGLLILAGCGGSDLDLGRVRGKITLDGEPLVNAKVEFDPESGSTSYGKTDVLGRYQLEFTGKHRGALVGQHVVRITTRSTTVDADGKEVTVPESLPSKFNRQSTLTKDVRPGSNVIDIQLELESAGEA